MTRDISIHVFEAVSIDRVSADIRFLRWELGRYLFQIAAIYYFHAEHPHAQFVITSGGEGEPGDGLHSYNSKHYQQKAIDIRIWSLTNEQLTNIVNDLRKLLGEDYDVILEAGSHLHIEFDS